MPQLFANNALSVLAAALTNVATSLSVTPGTGVKFPVVDAVGPDFFLVTLFKITVTGEIGHEIIRVTVRATATPDTMTIVRAQEGTTALAFASGDRIELRLTRDTLVNKADLVGSAAQSFSMLNGTVAGTLGVTGVTTLNGRTLLQAASEPYAVRAKFVSTGGEVYFGATDGTATPGFQISSAGGGSLLSGTNAGAVTIPGTLSAANVGVGVAPLSSRALYLAGTRTATVAQARGISMGADLTLVAAANNDVLSALFLGPVTFTVGTFTGVAQYAIKSTSTAPSELSGNLSLIGASSTLGYGAGSGGTVAQATSKSTAVTLNKASGRIETAADALAAGADVQFSCNNSLATVNDITVCTVNGGGANSTNYRVRAISGTGIIYFRIKNESAGSLSDVVVIHFAVIKGAAS